MLLALTLIILLSLTNPSQARSPHKRLIIHVPLRIKTHHHTHTVYAHIRSTSSSGGGKEASREHGGGAKQTIYKIVSLAMQGKGYGGHTGYNGYGGHGGHGQAAHKRGHSSGAENGRYKHETHSQGAADIMYDDYHGGGGGDGDGGGDERAGRCTDGPHGYGDMVFNHFSRSSDESNESEEYPEVAEYVDEDEQGFVWE
ncbi:glycine-rich cell wall structural protein [Ceratitis capitata]|uniref:glycine-rich cell wall structural protein n=1 Tax=Ceratitis capitata TaxID=7213 RepID=UPI00032A0B57|nr:glycine-rich cell wall structural protein [Ceratitis capitata]